MKVAVIGYSIEGRSALNYWRNLGDQVTIHDANPELEIPADISSHLGPDYLAGLNRYDLIVRSPGVKPSAIHDANPDLDASKITSVTNQFLAECPAKVIGVTGTKGKGTTSTLITKMLEAVGHQVWLGGNIGTPALDLLPRIQPEDWVVLELSSFQLMDVRRSPHVAVMLMIAPDHLNWHPHLQEYAAAKQNIFRFQQPGDRAIYNACNILSLRAGLGAPGDQMAFNDPAGAWVDGNQVKVGQTQICTTDQIGLPGRHNWDNVCAALAAVWPIVADPAPLKQAIAAFTGLEHRLEQIAEIDGVTYINDSYSSNPEPTMAALRAYSEPKVLIVGGTDRQLSWDALAREIAAARVRQVIVVGEVSPKITKALDAVGFSDYTLGGASMPDIVAAAATAAQPGDIVLLSPGAPSFDMFTNFTDRGEQFKAAVQKLAQRS